MMLFYPNEPIINGATVAQHMGNDTDRRCGTKPRYRPVGSIVGAPVAPESFRLIPRVEWPDRIADMEREKSRLSDLITYADIPVLSQEWTSFCWAYSCALAVMAKRAQMGLPYVQLSPESIAGPVNGYRDGGNYISEALRQVISVGISSIEFVPHLQIEASGFKRGWKENAGQHKAVEFWDLGCKQDRMFDRVMTLLFAREPIPVAYDWWRHSVCLCDPVMIAKNRFGVRFRNSWPGYGANGYAVLEEGYGTPHEAYALRSIVLPNS